MKKDIKKSLWILLLAALLPLSACEDFLNSPPVGSLSAEGFYLTPKQSEQGVVGVYSLLRSLTSTQYWFLSEVRSDNVWARPIPNGGFRNYSELSNFRALPSLDIINNGWNQWYRVIYDANTALSKIPGCNFGTNEAFKDQLMGELYFLRGWAYFELVRLYGNIPIVNTPLSPDDAANVPQSDAKTVYDTRIVPDLLEAKNLLPLEQDLKNVVGASATAYGRAGQLAATAMLGKVYMTMAGFPVNDASKRALAKNELKAIIDYSEANGNQFWAPDSIEWRKQWMSEYNNTYSIFAIQHRSGGTGNTAISEMSMEWPSTYSRWTPGISCEGWLEKSLVFEFTKRYPYTDAGGTPQTRKDARGFGYTLYSANFPVGIAPGWTAAHAVAPTYEDITIDGETLTIETNAYIYKFLNSYPKRAELGFTTDIQSIMTARGEWPVNYPVIRYEDVLLMYAEILASEGTNGDGTVNTTTALGIVNKIRERAGCTPETDATKAMEFIKRERRIEFAGEGIRWFDIVRWNDWRQNILDMFTRYGNPEATSPNNVTVGRHLYPIPEEQNNVKPGFYIQNEGYSF